MIVTPFLMVKLFADYGVVGVLALVIMLLVLILIANIGARVLLARNRKRMGL